MGRRSGVGGLGRDTGVTDGGSGTNDPRSVWTGHKGGTLREVGAQETWDDEGEGPYGREGSPETSLQWGNLCGRD